MVVLLLLGCAPPEGAEIAAIAGFCRAMAAMERTEANTVRKIMMVTLVIDLNG
jgi:hypothetical protein